MPQLVTFDEYYDELVIVLARLSEQARTQQQANRQQLQRQVDEETGRRVNAFGRQQKRERFRDAVIRRKKEGPQKTIAQGLPPQLGLVRDVDNNQINFLTQYESREEPPAPPEGDIGIFLAVVFWTGNIWPSPENFNFKLEDDLLSGSANFNSANTYIYSWEMADAVFIGSIDDVITEQEVNGEPVIITTPTLTVSSMISGSLKVGQVIVGGGVATNTTITGLGTGVNGVGTYIVNQSQIVESTVMTVNDKTVGLKNFLEANIPEPGSDPSWISELVFGETHHQVSPPKPDPETIYPLANQLLTGSALPGQMQIEFVPIASDVFTSDHYVYTGYITESDEYFLFGRNRYVFPSGEGGISIVNFQSVNG